MAEEDDEASPQARQPGEGVRIIGAEEASAAVEAGGPRERPAADEVPPPPPPTRQPTLRFPVEDSGEGEAAYAPEGGAADRVTGAGPMPDLPHWTEPATGEVPRILP